MALDDLELI